ncbi:glycerophosphodiester phosphodiesterase [Bacillus sp. AK031]
MIIRIFLSFLLSFSVFCFLNGITESFAADKEDNTLIVAHRGASSLAPENTLSAFDKAVSLKADYIELDVQMTKDGEIIVMHDVTVDRTTNGSGRVKNLTYEQIADLDAGSWFSPKFQGERVPALQTVLDRYEGKIGILIELKKPSIYPEIEEELAKLLAERITPGGPAPKIIVQSFNKQSIIEFHELNPSIPTGIIVGTSTDYASEEDLFAVDGFASFINPNASLVTESFMKQAKEKNLNVFSWTVADSKTANHLKRLNVNGIVTDYPAENYFGSDNALNQASFLISAITFLFMLLWRK